MGRIAAELADDVIVTDDNPRTEDPAHIVADILAGMPGRQTMVEHDRKRAIQTTLRRSLPGDVVVIAGKGHEDYQIYGTVKRPFSDQAVVSAEFAAAGQQGAEPQAATESQGAGPQSAGQQGAESQGAGAERRGADAGPQGTQPRRSKS